MSDQTPENPDINIIPPGMLSSPQIKYCISKGLLVSHEEEEPEVLLKYVESAVYKMRLGTTVLSYDEENKRVRKEYKLNDEITLNPNSLSFVTVWEHFNLPTDIIARFNLKSSLVHKGLLLGTGPIVDPEFIGRICIPLHNFSNFPVVLECGKTLINVEFTRTLPTTTVPNLNCYLDFDKYKYESNEHGSFNLEDFLSKLSPLPQSSIQRKMIDFEQSIEKARTTQFWSLVAAGIGVLSLLFAGWSMHASIRESIENSTLRDEQFRSTVASPLNSKLSALQKENEILQGKYQKSQDEINEIKNQILYLKNSIKEENEKKELPLNATNKKNSSEKTHSPKK